MRQNEKLTDRNVVTPLYFIVCHCILRAYVCICIYILLVGCAVYTITHNWIVLWVYSRKKNNEKWSLCQLESRQSNIAFKLHVHTALINNKHTGVGCRRQTIIWAHYGRCEDTCKHCLIKFDDIHGWCIVKKANAWRTCICMFKSHIYLNSYYISCAYIE